MSYRVKNDRTYKWICGVYGEEHWVDIGPADPRPAHLRYRDACWSVMAHYERIGPNCTAYRIVQRWAVENLQGMGPYGNGETFSY